MFFKYYVKILFTLMTEFRCLLHCASQEGAGLSTLVLALGLAFLPDHLARACTWGRNPRSKPPRTQNGASHSTGCSAGWRQAGQAWFLETSPSPQGLAEPAFTDSLCMEGGRGRAGEE